MLRSLKELLGYELLAKDGQIGKVHNFLFSDEDWAIRYLIADTGPWIFGRKVLIGIPALGQPVWMSKTFPVELTREQVESSPDADLEKTVSRQYEEKLHEHYQWPAYWSMSVGVTGVPTYIPPHLFPIQKKSVHDKDNEERSHLRSAKELFGYKVDATDGEVGSVTDFIIDDENWQIRYMVVDTENSELESDKQVLLALEWINNIQVANQKISIDLIQEAIKFSPAFDPNLPVNRQFEEVLYDYHGRPKYWQTVE